MYEVRGKKNHVNWGQSNWGTSHIEQHCKVIPLPMSSLCLFKIHVIKSLFISVLLLQMIVYIYPDLGEWNMQLSLPEGSLYSKAKV